MKKRLLILLSALILFPTPAFASTKITSVSLKITSDEEPENGELPELEITTGSKKYSVEGYDVTVDLSDSSVNGEVDEDGNDTSLSGPGIQVEEPEEEENSETEEEESETSTETKNSTRRVIREAKIKSTDNSTASTTTNTTSGTTSTETTKAQPVTIEITLTADEDYYFYSMSKSKISFSGYEANCTKAVRQDSGQTLVLTVQLTGIKTEIGKANSAVWDSEGVGSWTPVSNAATYEVQLYRNGTTKGQAIETAGRVYDFTPMMTSSGSYSYTVRAISADGERGKRATSDTIEIGKELAEIYKDMYLVEYENTDTSMGPSVERDAINVGWQESNGKWWYRTEDGLYPQSMWQEIDGDWYWFDSDGYMASNAWVAWKGKEYYVGENGKMLRDTTTPDGFTVNEKGEKKS